MNDYMCIIPAAKQSRISLVVSEIDRDTAHLNTSTYWTNTSSFGPDVADVIRNFCHLESHDRIERLAMGLSGMKLLFK